MDPQILQQLMGAGGTPPVPQGPPTGGTQSPPQPSGPPWMPLLGQALDKLSNMGVPFVGDIAHLIMVGGGNPQTWQTLLKTIDAYGKHKQSVQGASMGAGPTSPQPPPAPPQPMTPGNPQPPGVYS